MSNSRVGGVRTVTNAETKILGDGGTESTRVTF